MERGNTEVHKTKGGGVWGGGGEMNKMEKDDRDRKREKGNGSLLVITIWYCIHHILLDDTCYEYGCNWAYEIQASSMN